MTGLPDLVYDEDKDYISLAEFLADIITSPHNQHCVVRFVGSAGTGKSWAAVDLAVEVSKIVAERKGGDPEDYYNFNDNLAVMNKDDIKRVMTNPKQYAIIHLDDVGVPVNARNYQDQYNIDFNDIIQTFRPNHNLVIMTMQAAFLIDKVPRTLAHIEIEMEASNFDEGFTVAKVQRIILKHKSGKIHYPFLVINGVRYVRHIFEKPDENLMAEYERIRATQLKKLNEPAPEIIVIPQQTKKERIKELHRDWEAGVFGGMTFKEVCIANKLNPAYARNVI
jgi:hypothetical protein